MYIAGSIREVFANIDDAGIDTPLLTFNLGLLRGKCVFYKDCVTLERCVFGITTIYYKDASLIFLKPAISRYKKVRYAFSFISGADKIYINGRRLSLEDNEHIIALIEKVSGIELDDSRSKLEVRLSAMAA